MEMGIPDYVGRERSWGMEKYDNMTVGEGGYIRLEDWANSLVDGSKICT